MTKTQKVKDHLLNGKSITSLQAIELYHATRLSAIIYNLIHKCGMQIEGRAHTYTDNDGNTVRYKEYYLHKGE